MSYVPKIQFYRILVFLCFYTTHAYLQKDTECVIAMCSNGYAKNRDLNLVLFCSLQNVAVQSSIFSHHKYIYKYT